MYLNLRLFLSCLVAFLAINLFAKGTPALGAIAELPPLLFSTDFSGPTLDSHLEDPDGDYTIDGSAHRTTRFANGNGDSRHYIRTLATNFNEVDFVYELSLFLTDNKPCCEDHLFMGIGQATRSTFYSEPDNSIFINPHPVNQRSGVVRFMYIDDGTRGTIQFEFGELNSTNEHRVRMTKTGDLSTFEVDEDFSGVFNSDSASSTIDISSPEFSFLNSGNSHLFFGTGGVSTIVPRFDDMTVYAIPEPTTFALAALGLLGCIGMRRRRVR